MIAGAGGALAGLIPGHASGGKDGDGAKLVSDHGPQFPSLFSMSAFAVQGFVKGGWPMALDYELQAACTSTYSETVVGRGMRSPSSRIPLR